MLRCRFQTEIHTRNTQSLIFNYVLHGGQYLVMENKENISNESLWVLGFRRNFRDGFLADKIADPLRPANLTE